MSEKLSVLMPVFNEAASLEAAVRVVLVEAAKVAEQVEILVVDDCSTDDSWAIANRLAEEDDRIVPHRHERNHGPCSCLRTGPSFATGDWILLLPVDLAIPLSDIRTFWQAREGSDVVLGYVADPAGRPPARQRQSKTYTRLVNLAFGLDLHQVNYVALYRKNIFERMNLVSSGVALHAEILVRAHDLGFRISQIPVGYQLRSQGVSSGNQPRVILKTMRQLARFWWLRKFEK